MSFILAFFITFFPLSIFSGAEWPFSPDNDGCVRHRKPWYQLSTAEKDLFVRGFYLLRVNAVQDRLSPFTFAHRGIMKDALIHHTSIFTFWHDYLVWEIETQIRLLGGEGFECWSMPYWVCP